MGGVWGKNGAGSNLGWRDAWMSFEECEWSERGIGILKESV
jgi:hypothetical protein